MRTDTMLHKHGNAMHNFGGILIFFQFSNFFLGGGGGNKTIIPLALVGCEII